MKTILQNSLSRLKRTKIGQGDVGVWCNHHKTLQNEQFKPWKLYKNIVLIILLPNYFESMHPFTVHYKPINITNNSRYIIGKSIVGSHPKLQSLIDIMLVALILFYYTLITTAKAQLRRFDDINTIPTLKANLYSSTDYSYK